MMKNNNLNINEKLHQKLKDEYKINTKNIESKIIQKAKPIKNSIYVSLEDLLLHVIQKQSSNNDKIKELHKLFNLIIIDDIIKENKLKVDKETILNLLKKHFYFNLLINENKHKQKLSIPIHNYEQYQYNNITEILLKNNEITDYLYQKQNKLKLLRNFQFFDISNDFTIQFKLIQQTKIKLLQSVKKSLSKNDDIILSKKDYEDNLLSLNIE